MSQSSLVSDLETGVTEALNVFFVNRSRVLNLVDDSSSEETVTYQLGSAIWYSLSGVLESTGYN